MLPVGEDNGRARAPANELPGIALEIHGGGALTGRAWTRGAIILALQDDTKTLLFVGGHGSLLFLLGERSCAGEACQGA